MPKCEYCREAVLDGESVCIDCYDDALAAFYGKVADILDRHPDDDLTAFIEPIRLAV